MNFDLLSYGLTNDIEEVICQSNLWEMYTIEKKMTDLGHL